MACRQRRVAEGAKPPGVAAPDLGGQAAAVELLLERPQVAGLVPGGGEQLVLVHRAPARRRVPRRRGRRGSTFSSVSQPPRGRAYASAAHEP